MLEHLGPIYIKFGQMLSTRRDLLPVEYADELAKLQNEVTPFASEQAIAIVEENLGGTIDDVFESFNPDPIASASLAQVHAAKLKDYAEVAVKVIRPDIENAIKQDFVLMGTAASFLEKLSQDARRLHLVQIVSDHRTTVLNELNLLLEAENTLTIRRNFAESPLLYAPRVYRQFTTRNVLVMEHIHAIPISDTSTLIAKGTDMRKLAERGVETFFTQVFDHNFFHADMHPGNIFVDISDPADPHYVAIDCAIIGQLSTEDQNYLARNILAFLSRDYHEIARLHSESGWIGPHADVREFEAVIREICEPFFHKPLSEISFGHFLLSLFNAARQFRMEVQPQLVLLQKTLLNIEGLGRELYPDLDLWATAKPFMEQWMERNFGLTAVIKEFLDHLPEIVVQLPSLPELLIQTKTRLSRLERAQKTHEQKIEEISSKQNSKPASRVARMVGSLVFVVIGVGLLWQPITGWLQNHSIGWQAIVGAVALGIALLIRLKR